MGGSEIPNGDHQTLCRFRLRSNSTSWLLLLFLVFGLALNISTEKSENSDGDHAVDIQHGFYCHTAAPNGCTRICNHPQYSINCTQLRLQMEYNEWINVTCTTKEVSALNNCPVMQLGSVKLFRASYCPAMIVKHVGAHSIEQLILQTNGANTKLLHTDWTANMESLSRLLIVNSDMSTISHNQLQMIYKYGGILSKIERLPDGFLANLPMLREVAIMLCGLQTVPVDLFAGSVNMTKIDLSFNELRSLPRGIFDSVPHLVVLSLEWNHLTYLEDGLFGSLHDLQELKLSWNRLTHITSDFLAGPFSLISICISHNQINRISSDAFRNQNSLHEIHLSSNRIRLDQHWTVFENLPSLRQLGLRNNFISTLPQHSLSNYLKILDVSFNNITHFDGARFFLQFKGNIDLSNNSIEMLYAAQGTLQPSQLTQLEKLYSGKRIDRITVDGNPIVCNATLIEFLDHLENPVMRRFWQLDSLRCAHPLSLRGRFVKRLDTRELLATLAAWSNRTVSPVDQCPTNCTCSVRPVTRALLVNCSQTGSTVVPSLPDPRVYDLNQTELYVQHNSIRQLPAVEKTRVGTYEFVTTIDARHNHIEALRADHIPSQLRELYLQNNHLQTLEADVLKALHNIAPAQKTRVWLAENAWLCDCSAVELLEYMHRENISALDYLTDVRCADGELMRVKRMFDMCPPDEVDEHRLVWLLGGILPLLLMIVICSVLMALYYKHRQLMRVWMFGHPWMSRFVAEADVDADMVYDAFVSYSHMDGEFVLKCLVSELERGVCPYRLCIHERDWLAGGAIVQSIAESVEKSRRTIIVLTEHFVTSVWGRMEFRVAHKRALDDNRSRVIIVVCGQLQDMRPDKMDAELRAYLQTNTYIQWGDKWFWKKLRYAMPHR